jgi:hypothetical protein
MDVNECKLANWRDVGLRDGLAGAQLSLLDTRVKDCAKAQVAVDTQSFLRGRNQGLASYCRVENAVGLGLDGKQYQGVCPAGIDVEFRRRVQIGRDVRDLRDELSSLDRRREPLEKRLREAKGDDERRKIRNELGDLDRDLSRARDCLRDAEWQLDRLR